MTYATEAPNATVSYTPRWVRQWNNALKRRHLVPTKQGFDFFMNLGVFGVTHERQE